MLALKQEIGYSYTAVALNEKTSREFAPSGNASSVKVGKPFRSSPMSGNPSPAAQFLSEGFPLQNCSLVHHATGSAMHCFDNTNWRINQKNSDCGNYRPLEVRTLYYKNLAIRVVITPDGLEWVALDILRALFSWDGLCSHYWALQTLPVGFRPKRLINCGGESCWSESDISKGLLNIKRTLRVNEIPSSEMQDGVSFRTVILHEVLFGWLSEYLSDEAIHEFCDWFYNHSQLVDMGCKRQYRPDVAAYFA